MIIPHWLSTEFYYLIHDAMLCLFPFAVVFFLVFTVGLRDFEYRLNFRGIVKNIFMKLF